MTGVQTCALPIFVESSIQRSIIATTEQDRKAAEDVLESERKINQLEIQIDDVAVNLLALHQPVAADLRFIVSAVKINSDLERMGDLAVNIAQQALTLMEQPRVRPVIDVPYIASVVQSMVRNALDAFVARDTQLARGVLASDDTVDNLRTECFRELTRLMEQDPRNIAQALALRSVARNLERIADHATNVAEDVIFAVQGIDVRHHAEAATRTEPPK
mgnify:CR=1 FL=1